MNDLFTRSQFDTKAIFENIPREPLFTLGLDGALRVSLILVPGAWLIRPIRAIYDLDNIRLSAIKGNEEVEADFELENILVQGNLIQNNFRSCNRKGHR